MPRIVIIAISCFICFSAFANQKLHSIGLNYSYSDIDNGSDEKTSDLNDLVTTHYIYSYQYQVAESFSFGLGYLKGDSSKASGVLIDIFTDSKIDYSAILLSVLVDYPLSKRNFVYFKVDALQYDFDVVDDNEVVYSEDDHDFGFSIGWGYQFDNGLEINAGYEVLNLGPHLDIKGLKAGISYHF
ncbi:porin family protein [Thalassotalea ganghwensis]